jgi:DNA helicase-2/ATP-dependent DNA helicase PcrA
MPSLFLADIPAACVHDYSAQAILDTIRQPWSATAHFASPAGTTTPAAPPQPSAREPREPYAVGSQVVHQHFGRGVVQKREGDGERLKLTVIFRDHGVKKLLAKFAPMQPL